MTYQNRVTPFGDIIATPARGAFMGNRGILHNERQEIVRPYKSNNIRQSDIDVRSPAE